MPSLPCQICQGRDHTARRCPRGNIDNEEVAHIDWLNRGHEVSPAHTLALKHTAQTRKVHACILWLQYLVHAPAGGT